MAPLPSYTVIIPTCNGAAWLEELLSMLNMQTWPPDEILIFDSESEDDTRVIAENGGAKVHIVPKTDFDHGGTRSLAARMACGDLVVFLTQDAVPADDNALESLVRSFGDDRVGAAYGRQLPAPDAQPFATHLRLFNYPPASQIRCWQDRKRYGFRTIFISNSFAAYRRAVLEEINFFEEKQLFGEDSLALAKILQNGYCVAYVGGACVFHSHNYGLIDDCKRYFDIGAFHALHPELLAMFGDTGGAGKEFVFSELHFLLENRYFILLPISMMRNMGKFIAYHLGRRHRILPASWVRWCSMNPGWWN